MKRILAFVSVAVAVLAGAGPAHAAMDSNCYLNTPQPTTDGVNVYFTASVSCSTYMDNTAVQAGARILERNAAGYYETRAGWAYAYSGGTTYLPKSRSYNCNGNGTDTYRGTGYGKTSDNGSQTKEGSSRSLTC